MQRGAETMAGAKTKAPTISCVHTNRRKLLFGSEELKHFPKSVAQMNQIIPRKCRGTIRRLFLWESLFCTRRLLVGLVVQAGNFAGVRVELFHDTFGAVDGIPFFPQQQLYHFNDRDVFLRINSVTRPVFLRAQLFKLRFPVTENVVFFINQLANFADRVV